MRLEIIIDQFIIFGTIKFGATLIKQADHRMNKCFLQEMGDYILLKHQSILKPVLKKIYE